MKYVAIYTIIYFLNIVLYGSPLNLIITLPSIVYVIYLILKGDLSKALFAHLIFIITSVSHASIGDFEGTITPFGYFSLKVFGPVTFSYLINIVLFTLYLLKNKLHIYKNNIFHQLFLVLSIFAFFGSIIGLTGLLIESYSLSYFITYCVYVFNLIMLMTCMICDTSLLLKKKGKLHLYYILLAGIISTLILLVFGKTMSYGGVEVVTKPDIMVLSFLLIASLVQNDIRRTSIVFVILYLLIIFLGGASGKDFIFIGFSMLYVFYYYFRTNLLKAIFVIIILTIPSLFILNLGVESNQLFNDKFSQFASLFQVFNGNLDEVARSPYIRIASMINIYAENISNPLYFLFGRGYGGYFTDSLGLFSGVDLYMGAFSSDQINSGHFYFAHGSLAIVPLLHGFGGLFLICVIVWKFIKQSRYDYNCLVVIPWLFLMFYYNLLLAITCLYFLFCSYDYPKTNTNK